MPKIQSIPTNLITGFLGAGKSTAILNLLSHRPTGERWAVLVNEFGEVPIDQAILQSGDDRGVFVKEVAGGCLCCTAGVPMQVAIVQLLRQAQPERLLIELSGAGHPGWVLDTLRDSLPNLDLRATLCLVDPRQFTSDEILNSQVFHDQIHMSDVVVINKTHQATFRENEVLLRWVQGLYPPKSRIEIAENGHFQLSWLDEKADPLRAPLFPDAHDHSLKHGQDKTGIHRFESAQEEHYLLFPGKPYRKENKGYGLYTCGWIFSPEDIFNRTRLMDVLLQEYSVNRMKGVFRTGRTSMLFNRIDDRVTSQDIAYRRDSRVEVISTRREDWDNLEKNLIFCLT